MQASDPTYQHEAITHSVNNRFVFIVIILCIIIGLTVPSSVLVDWLRHNRPIPFDQVDQLLLGATIFRISLILLGIFLAVVVRSPMWRTDVPDRLQTTTLGRTEFLSIGVVCTVALVLRLLMLNSGLWLDEIITYVEYGRSMSLGEIASTYTSENQHFLYSLAARLSIMLFGDSAWSLRLPAVLFGVASIWALYKLACEVTTRQEALLASILMTFSYHHIWFSQNARGYTALLFWSLLSSYFFIRGLQKGAARDWLLYAACAALGTYTHTTMVFMIVGQFVSYLFVIYRQRNQQTQRWAPFFLGFCFVALFTLVLYSFALPQFFGRIVEESTVSDWKNPLWTVLEFVRGIQIGFGSSLLLVPALVVFGVGLVSYLKSRPILVALLMVPVAICGLVVVALGHHLWPRFFFFAMGFGLLIAVRGTWVTGSTAALYLRLATPIQRWAGAILTILMIVASTLTIPTAYGPKQDYEAALSYVETHRSSGDAVAVLGLATFPYRTLYKTDWQEIESAKDLSTVRSGNNQTWVIFTFLPEVESVYPDIIDVLHRDFKVQQEFPGTVNHGAIHVLKTDSSTSLR
jgi:mannosyltransferase